MSLYHIYFSPTGGVKQVSEALLEGLGRPDKQIHLLNQVYLANLALQPGDLCLVAVPCFYGRVPDYVREKLSQLSGHGAFAIAVIVYGNGEYGDSLLELRDILESCDLRVIAAVSAIAQHAIFSQYGKGRPNAEDKACLKDYALRIKQHLATGHFGTLNLKGHAPYHDKHHLSICPQAKGDCTNCMKCVEECPVQAIPRENPRCVDKSRCISCMHCVSICPEHARTLNQAVLFVIARALKINYNEPKNNTLTLSEREDKAVQEV